VQAVSKAARNQAASFLARVFEAIMQPY
jgi:hypothetical protein